MSRRNKLLSIALGLVAFALLIAYAALREVRSNAALACAASIHQRLVSSDNAGLGVETDRGPAWRILSGGESDGLVLELARNGSLDCRKREGNGLPVDYWSNRFRVAARRTAPGGNLEFVVWSDGPDGMTGTWDDIVSPYGEKAPR